MACRIQVREVNYLTWDLASIPGLMPVTLRKQCGVFNFLGYLGSLFPISDSCSPVLCPWAAEQVWLSSDLHHQLQSPLRCQAPCSCSLTLHCRRSFTCWSGLLRESFALVDKECSERAYLCTEQLQQGVYMHSSIPLQ